MIPESDKNFGIIFKKGLSKITKYYVIWIGLLLDFITFNLILYQINNLISFIFVCIVWNLFIIYAQFILIKWKNLKNELKIANKAKSDFIANMSHELRTPLNSIIGFAEIVLDELTGPINVDQKELLGDILESGGYLLQLIENILDLSQIESGEITLNLKEFSIKNLLERPIELFKTYAIQHKINLLYNISDKIDIIVADEQKIKQILFNLLSNAIKFTPNGGEVGVIIKSTHEEIVFIIWDTGIGITKSDMNKLFQPFQQIEIYLTKKYQGIGNGLYFCKKLVELHGGKIWVENGGIDENVGSRFCFSIPKHYERNEEMEEFLTSIWE